MKILVYGVGGIGGFLGSYLEKLGIQLTFIARGKRLNHLKSKGLILESNLKNISLKDLDVRSDIDNGESFDIIINTVKLYDFDYVIANIIKKVKGNFIILPFQNGIYAEEKIKEKIGENRTFGAVAQISSFVDKNQNIKHVGDLATFFVGSYEKNDENILKVFCENCQRIGLDLRFTMNIKEKIWQKFIFLSAYSGMTTLTEKTIGEIFSDENLKQKFIKAMIETYELSNMYAVKFEKNPIDFWIEKIERMPYEMTSSMFMDFKNKKKLEIDWLSGSIIKLSEQNNLKPDIHKEIVSGIKAK